MQISLITRSKLWYISYIFRRIQINLVLIRNGMRNYRSNGNVLFIHQHIRIDDIRFVFYFYLCTHGGGNFIQ